MSRSIFADQDVIAEIETYEAQLVLRYEPSWVSRRGVFPASLTMPLDRPEHLADVVLPWLMNLLPEGEPLRAMTRAMGVSPDDILSLIDATGRRITPRRSTS